MNGRSRHLCECDVYLRCFAAGATVWLRNFLPIKFKDMDTFSAPELTYMMPECLYLCFVCKMIQSTRHNDKLQHCLQVTLRRGCT